MTSRERVIAAIEFKGPDRVPYMHQTLPAAYSEHPLLPQLYARYPSDFAGQDGVAPAGFGTRHTPGQYTDEWGCGWTVLKPGYLGQVTYHPLAGFDKLADYEFPSIDSFASMLKSSQAVTDNRGCRYVLLGNATLFERMIDLCGFENLLSHLALGSPAILKIRDKIVDCNLSVVRELLKLNPDGIAFSDDWGTQLNLIIPPKMWRDVFLPAYRRLFAVVKDAGKHVYMHSDGVTIDILPDLVDAGVNLFWVDLTVNPLARLHRELGGKVCFKTLTDVQFLLHHGTTASVRQHGRDLIAALGCFKGGVIGCHEVAPDQSWENIVTMVETLNEDGRYPLKFKWEGVG